MDMIFSFFETLSLNLQKGAWFGVIIQSILILCVLLLCVMAATGLYELVKYCFTLKTYSKEKRTEVKIVDRKYQASYTTTTTIIMPGPNNTTQIIPQTHYHPEEFNVKMEFPNGEIFVENNRKLYEFVKMEQKYSLTYQDVFVTWIFSNTPKPDGLKLLKIKDHEGEIELSGISG